MRLKRWVLLLSTMITVLILCTPVALWGCTQKFDRGTVFAAIERTLALPGDNPVRDDLINRGLVKLAFEPGETGYIDGGQIEELVKDGFYQIDENGYLKFGPSYTPITVIPTPS
jgi:hypothetical protein